MNTINNTTFYKLSTAEIVNLRREGLLNTQSFIYFYFRSLNPFGNKPVNIDRQKFCKEFKISLRSYWRAVRKLSQLGKFDFGKNDIVSAKNGTVSAKSDTNDEPEAPEIKHCSESKIKDKRLNKLASEENFNDYQKIAIDSNEKAITKKEVIENEELPQEPHKHEELIKFVASEFVSKYNESRERGRENAIKHLMNRNKARIKWQQYLEADKAKKLADRRHQELIERKHREQEIPVNNKALAILSNFAKGLRGN